MEAIVAVYENWGIGKDGTQPLVLSADRKRFRQITGNHAVIVGRKTLADFPGGKPLPGRRNIVLSRNAELEIPGAEVCSSPAMALLTVYNEEKIFLIGGASVYQMMLPFCRKVHVTKIFSAPECDSFFPDLDAAPGWKCTETGEMQEENGVSFQFLTYEREEFEGARPASMR